MESVEVQRLRQMLKASRSMLRELAIACARVEEELDRNANAQPQEAQRAHNYSIGPTCREWQPRVAYVDSPRITYVDL
jgi:hypothetical protein